MSKTPPALTKFFLSKIAPDEIKESYLGDLEEQFHLIGKSAGYPKARRWYHIQLFVSILPLQQLSMAGRPIGKDIVVLLVIAVAAGVIRLEHTSVLFHVVELFAILLAAFTAGYVCTSLLAKNVFMVPISCACIFMVAVLFIRGEPEEIPWMLPFMFIVISAGFQTFKSFRKRRDQSQGQLG